MAEDLSAFVNRANELAGVNANGEPEVIQPKSNVLPNKEAEEKRLEALKLLQEEEGKEVETKVEPKQEETVDPQAEIERLKKELEDLKSKKEPEVDPLKVVEESVTKAGIDLTELEKTYVESGSLTKEQLESLAKAGFDEKAIDAYIEMREHKQIEAENKLLNSIGISSRDEYIEMAKWMAETLPKEEIAVYDKGVEDESLREYLIKTYYQKYSASKGIVKQDTNVTTTIRGRGVQTQPAESNTFKSIEEVAQAMADPRYRNDHKYRNSVLTKLQNSNY